MRIAVAANQKLGQASLTTLTLLHLPLALPRRAF